MGCPVLLQGIFPTQGLNLRLLHCRQLSHWKSPACHEVWQKKKKKKSHPEEEESVQKGSFLPLARGPVVSVRPVGLLPLSHCSAPARLEAPGLGWTCHTLRTGGQSRLHPPIHPSRAQDELLGIVFPGIWLRDLTLSQTLSPNSSPLYQQPAYSQDRQRGMLRGAR